MSSNTHSEPAVGLPSVDDRPSRTGRARAVLVALGLTVVGLVVGTVFGASAVVAEVVLTGALLESSAFFVASAALTMVGYALVALAYARRYDRPIPARLPTRREAGWVLGGTVLALTVVTALSVLVAALGIEAAPNAIGVIGSERPAVLLALAVLSILAVGPAEELLFRGAVQGRLREAFGPVGAVLGASAIFAAVHAFAVVGTVGATLVTVSILMVTSLVLGAAYERTRNVVVPALLHGLYNATLLTLAYVAVVAG